MEALIGYMRISTKDQRLDLQRDALLAAGVPERFLFQDIASGAMQTRAGLTTCLTTLRAGDTLVVWRLDRLARSLLHLMELAQDLEAREVGLRVLEGPFAHMDTTTSEGKLLFSLLGAFAEFERALIRERVVAGLAAARARGHHGGRKPKLTRDQQRQAQALKRGGMAITEIARQLGCARKTIYKALAAQPVRA